LRRMDRPARYLPSSLRREHAPAFMTLLFSAKAGQDWSRYRSALPAPEDDRSPRRHRREHEPAVRLVHHMTGVGAVIVCFRRLRTSLWNAL